MEFMEQQVNAKMHEALANDNVRPAEPDQRWTMELEKRHKEACGQIEFHTAELRRWHRMARSAKAALAALREPMPECDESEGPDY